MDGMTDREYVDGVEPYVVVAGECPAAPATGVRVAGRTPCRDPAAPRYLAGSWIRAPPAACRPHAARGALISSAAASGGRMPERARHMPLFGTFGLWRGRCRRVVRPRPERGQRARWGRSSGKP